MSAAQLGQLVLLAENGEVPVGVHAQVLQQQLQFGTGRVEVVVQAVVLRRASPWCPVLVHRDHIAFNWREVLPRSAMRLSNRPPASAVVAVSRLAKMRSIRSPLRAGAPDTAFTFSMVYLEGLGLRRHHRIHTRGRPFERLQRLPDAAEGIDIPACLGVRIFWRLGEHAVDVGEHAFRLSFQRVDLFVHRLGEAELGISSRVSPVAPFRGVAGSRLTARVKMSAL